MSNRTASSAEDTNRLHPTMEALQISSLEIVKRYITGNKSLSLHFIWITVSFNKSACDISCVALTYNWTFSPLRRRYILCIAIQPKNTEISFWVHIAQPYVTSQPTWKLVLKMPVTQYRPHPSWTGFDKNFNKNPLSQPGCTLPGLTRMLSNVIFCWVE